LKVSIFDSYITMASSCSQNILVLVLLLALNVLSNAWVSPSAVSRRVSLTPPSCSALYSSVTADSSSMTTEEDDDEEYEYVELDYLAETEFLGSEWLIGTCMDKNPNKIVETWCRLAVDKNGKNVAIWGDNSEGTWNWDVASQFLSFSKEALWGKDIWAGVVDDYYYMQGTVRGWSFFSAAKVVAQWQAKRLGVDPEEAGIAFWNQVQEEEGNSISTAIPDPEEATEEKSSD
jgi:hypothetical protein